MQSWWTVVVDNVSRSPVMAAWFTATGAFLAAGISALVSYLVAHRSVYINAVTAERSKWIEALRATISKYSGAAGRVRARRDEANYSTSPAWADDTEQLQTLLSDLILRLNPTEPEARNLLRAARKLDQAARLHSHAAVLLANEVMIRHAQWLAKAEWERVKQEASGLLMAPYYGWRARRRKADYAAFLLKDGDLARLDAIGAGKDAKLTKLRSDMDL